MGVYMKEIKSWPQIRNGDRNLSEVLQFSSQMWEHQPGKRIESVRFS